MLNFSFRVFFFPVFFFPLFLYCRHSFCVWKLLLYRIEWAIFSFLETGREHSVCKSSKMSHFQFPLFPVISFLWHFKNSKKNLTFLMLILALKIQVRLFEWSIPTVTEGAILKVVEETASEGGRCELQKNRQHHYHEMSLLFCCYFSGLGVVIIMVEEDNQMRKVMPAEFLGLQDCKVRIEGETNREVNQKGPCDELIEAEGKGETSESINLNAWHVNGMTPYVMYSLWNVLLLDALENGNVSH